MFCVTKSSFLLIVVGIISEPKRYHHLTVP